MQGTWVGTREWGGSLPIWSSSLCPLWGRRGRCVRVPTGRKWGPSRSQPSSHLWFELIPRRRRRERRRKGRRRELGLGESPPPPRSSLPLTSSPARTSALRPQLLCSAPPVARHPRSARAFPPPGVWFGKRARLRGGGRARGPRGRKAAGAAGLGRPVGARGGALRGVAFTPCTC